MADSAFPIVSNPILSYPILTPRPPSGGRVTTPRRPLGAEGDCAIPVPRLGGNTRRGVTIVLPNARSRPTLLGGGTA